MVVLQARDSMASTRDEVHARLEEGQAEQAVCSGALQAAAARRIEMEMQADALERQLAEALAACQARDPPKHLVQCSPPYQGFGIRFGQQSMLLRKFAATFMSFCLLS